MSGSVIHSQSAAMVPAVYSAGQSAQLPVAIDYPAALALRQMSMVHDELPKYLLAPEVSALLHYVPDLRRKMLLATLLLIHLQILRPLSLLSQALRTIRSGHSISELPRVRIRELQDVLDVLPDISRHMDELNTRSGQLAQERDQYADLSFRDALTGVYNRRALEETMERIPARTPLALLMLDLDFFKNYNDRFGHQAGDAALKAVAQATQKALLRDSDKIFRYGGEEFTIILAGAGQYSAMTVAQRILEEVAALDLVHPDSRTGKLTVSIGIAHRSFGEDADICEVLTHADQALYEAKTSGRNRIVLFEG